MSDSQGNNSVSDTKIWMVMLFILLIFVVVISYARQVNINRQSQAVPIVARYTNYAYGVNLRYPPEWRPVGGQAYDRYEGDSGFFSISAGGAPSDSIDKMVSSAINSKDKLYGDTPVVQNLVIDGEEARLVMPSLDQKAALKGQAVLIVKYPTPKIIGPNTYKYLVFWADRANIQDIVSSITFVR